MSDAEFVNALAVADSEEPVPRRRLAKLFFSVASTLDGGKTSVAFLQSRLSIRDPSRDSVRGVVSARYDAYAASVERFKGNVSDLLDKPDSPLLLYRVLTAGHRACWGLDTYIRLVETYGVTSSDLMSVLSSREGCARFRVAAFQPSVEAIVTEALLAELDPREEILALYEELASLERLLDDLARIEDDH
jgi:hypothetical protein